MNRLHNLDYLRGLAAFGIMVFHYMSWTVGEFTADTFLGRVGVYGVSIFYILSGLTLYFVYAGKMNINKADLLSFFKKRIFRIFPLLWLVTIAAVILSKKIPNFFDLFLNLSGLFGFIKWDTYFSAGVWSIGNELVFYVFFPFFILFSQKSKLLLALLTLILFTLFSYFAFFKLDPTQSLDNQWFIYVNPLNQVFLFLSGFLMGLLFNKVSFNDTNVIILLIISFTGFVFYPVSGDNINLVTGINRIVFTLLCFTICFTFYKLKSTLPSYIHSPLTLLGEASYSVYLLHPIIYKITGFLKYTLHFSDVLRLVVAGILTLIISYFTYKYFEKYFMRLAKK